MKPREKPRKNKKPVHTIMTLIIFLWPKPRSERRNGTVFITFTQESQHQCISIGFGEFCSALKHAKKTTRTRYRQGMTLIDLDGLGFNQTGFVDSIHSISSKQTISSSDNCATWGHDCAKENTTLRSISIEKMSTTQAGHPYF